MYNAIIIIIKPEAQAQVGKIKNVSKLLSKPHKHLRPGNQKNTTHGSNRRLTAPLNPSNVQVSNTVYGRSFHMKYFADLDVQHVDTSNSN